MAPTIAVAPPPTAPRPGTVSWGWKQRAAQFYCLLLLFGFPLFSVPCQKGSCSSPLEVVATYGYAKSLVPEKWTIALLYPATLMLNMEVLMGDEPQSFKLPAWDSILPAWNLSVSLIEKENAANHVSFNFIPSLTSMFDPHDPNSLGWEFIGACVVCLLGGVLSIGGPNKISFWGTLLVLWFIFIEGGKRTDVFAQPMFALAIACSLGWVNFKNLFTFPRADEPAAADANLKDESKKRE